MTKSFLGFILGFARPYAVFVDHAIAELYDDRTGNLIVEASRSGPRFRIDIEGGGSKGGIDMMKIFCFDTALLRIAFERFNPGSQLLIHDSHRL